MDIEALQTQVRKLANDAWDALDDEHRDRQIILEKLIDLIDDLWRLAGPKRS